MKKQKMLRFLGMIVLLTMLMAVIPAAPALGAVTLVLSPTQAKVGATVSYMVSGYGVSAAEYYIDVYISDQSVTSGSINTTVTRYKRVRYGDGILDNGDSYSGSFVIPATLDEGSVGAVTPLTVTSGVTYYIYTSTRYLQAFAEYPPQGIQSYAAITITPGASLDALTPANGPAGTTVSISGGNFPASTALVFMLDTTTALTPTGDATTRSSGIFISTITIPAGTAAGAHTITVTAGTSSATATFTVTSPPTIDTFTPASGAAGTLVTITGANFLAGTPIVFKFDTVAITPNSGAQTGTGGTIASVITIPASAAVGAHTVSITVGTVTISKEFAVTSTATTTPPTTTPPTTTPPTTTPPTTTPPTTTPPSNKGVLSINQSSHAVGATIGIGGAGFTPNATVTIKYDDAVISTAKVATNGTFISDFFKAPVSAKGDHTITASDGSISGTTKFTMESTAPKVPPPLKPELGAKAKSPVTFDWTDVADESVPVTYQLQIATDRNFSASSLVLNKTAIDSSSYTMTEIEELKLAGSDLPYYWRVQAIDAASNASGWTGAGEFYIPGPFKFPAWGIYAGVAGGAIIIFLLGMWIGRRTAFMY